MLKKIFKLKKGSTDFFLELNEEQSSQEASQEATSPSQTTVAPQPVQQEQPQASSSDVKKTKSQKKPKKASKKTEEPVAVSQPAPPKPAYDNVEQLIMNAVSGKKVSEEKANSNGVSKNFSTDYLISPPAPNRRPGASLNKFREMTRTMKAGK